jgi:hypothetical protein
MAEIKQPLDNSKTRAGRAWSGDSRTVITKERGCPDDTFLS